MLSNTTVTRIVATQQRAISGSNNEPILSFFRSLLAAFIDADRGDACRLFITGHHSVRLAQEAWMCRVLLHVSSLLIEIPVR